jgi:hypothetical protein
MALADMNPRQRTRRNNLGASKLCKAARIIADPEIVGLDAEDGPWLKEQLDLDFREETAAAIPYQLIEKMLEEATMDTDAGPLYVSATLLGMHARSTCACRVEKTHE